MSLKIPSTDCDLEMVKSSRGFTALGKVELPHSIHSSRGGGLSSLPHRAQLLTPRRRFPPPWTLSARNLRQDSTPGAHLHTCSSYPAFFPLWIRWELGDHAAHRYFHKQVLPTPFLMIVAVSNFQKFKIQKIAIESELWQKVWFPVTLNSLRFYKYSHSLTLC